MTSDVLISSSHPLSSVSNIPFTALSPRPIRSSHPQWNVFGTNLLLRRLARTLGGEEEDVRGVVDCSASETLDSITEKLVNWINYDLFGI